MVLKKRTLNHRGEKMIAQTVLDFKLDITKETLTSHAGLAVMAEFNHGLGLRRLVDSCLPQPRSNRGYQPSVYVDSLILMLQGGGRFLDDLRELRQDKGLSKILKTQVIPDAGATGDWLRRMGNDTGGLSGLSRVGNSITARIMRRDGLSNYTLDMDASEIIGEKESAKWTYKGNRGYMPMFGFLAENGICIHDEMRDGNVAPADRNLEFYLDCKARMPEGKRISYCRIDSAGYQADVINELNSDEVKYAIGIKKDSAVKELIDNAKNWHEPEPGCGYELAETVHCMEKTKEPFRVVLKRWISPKQAELFEQTQDESLYDYHGVATNYDIEEKDSQSVYHWYSQRGTAENRIREVKIGFNLEYMPCGETIANAVYLRIGTLAYNLFLGFKLLTCPKEWKVHTIATFRWKFIQIAGRVVRHAGSVILKLATDMNDLLIWKRIRENIYEFCSSYG